MNISIGEKKVFGGAAPRQERLKDYRRPGGVTMGALCDGTGSAMEPNEGKRWIEQSGGTSAGL